MVKSASLAMKYLKRGLRLPSVRPFLRSTYYESSIVSRVMSVSGWATIAAKGLRSGRLYQPLLQRKSTLVTICAKTSPATSDEPNAYHLK